MKLTDIIAILALLISSGALALEVRRWFESGPRLTLSVIGDAVEVPATDAKPKLALSVYNRGGELTIITHVLVFIYTAPWRFRGKKPTFTAIVNRPEIPCKLEPNHYWIGTVNYDQKTPSARSKGTLYVGIYASHSDRPFLIKVPPEQKKKLPTSTIGQ